MRSRSGPVHQTHRNRCHSVNRRLHIAPRQQFTAQAPEKAHAFLPLSSFQLVDIRVGILDFPNQPRRIEVLRLELCGAELPREFHERATAARAARVRRGGDIYEKHGRHMSSADALLRARLSSWRVVP